MSETVSSSFVANIIQFLTHVPARLGMYKILNLSSDFGSFFGKIVVNVTSFLTHYFTFLPVGQELDKNRK